MASKLVTAASAVLLLAGCTVTVERDTHFYPNNSVAEAGGVLSGHWVGHGHLHGVADVTMPNGEVLNGDYSIIPFGGASAVVGGPLGLVSGESMSAGGSGEANMRGPNGTAMTCGFQNNNLTGHGYGTCQSSPGGAYRLTY
jgi:hypothetical protein